MIRNQVGLWIVSNGSTIAETDVVETCQRYVIGAKLDTAQCN